MVNRLRTLTPAISFGFGITEITAAPGEAVTVWLDTIYNADEYTFHLSAQTAVRKISGYEYIISSARSGMYEINLSVISKNKKISLQSNTIELTVK